MSQPSPQPSWKQEVNQRLAEHKSRKGLSVVTQPEHSEAQGAASSRAAQAAARVAARYAQAPSYSEMQAAEARAALRAAEAATRVALEAQAAAQVALDNLETADDEQFSRDEESARREFANNSVEQAGEMSALPPSFTATGAATGHAVQIRWDPDLPVRLSAPPAQREREELELAEDNWRGTEAQPEDFGADQSIETVEPAQPIHANLIQFPREIVATRRLRPRIAGSEPGASIDPYGQLSIFEVDPNSISTEAPAPAAEAGLQAPELSGAEWSGIELDALPATDSGIQAETAAAASRLHLAPFGLRLMAAVIDTALIIGFVCADAAMVASRMQHPPSIKAAELGAIIAILVTSALYHWLFLMLGRATPGMKYARVSLCTFDDENPSREQLRSRLRAMLLSVLPVGLGLAWAIFDDDHLSWHDRLSRTYLRSY
ncbi:MAG: RDD family protein [Terracidiphilus sp.]